MEKVKYYRVYVPGMVADEYGELEIPEVIARELIVAKKDNQNIIGTRYKNTPMYVKMIDGFLYDVITDDLIRPVNTSRKTICYEPELIAIKLEEVPASKVAGSLIELTDDDVIRYCEQVENLKNACLKTYQKKQKSFSEIEDYDSQFFEDYVDDYSKDLKNKRNKKNYL